EADGPLPRGVELDRTDEVRPGRCLGRLLTAVRSRMPLVEEDLGGHRRSRERLTVGLRAEDDLEAHVGVLSDGGARPLQVVLALVVVALAVGLRCPVLVVIPTSSVVVIRVLAAVGVVMIHVFTAVGVVVVFSCIGFVLRRRRLACSLADRDGLGSTMGVRRA